MGWNQRYIFISILSVKEYHTFDYEKGKDSFPFDIVDFLQKKGSMYGLANSSLT